MSDPELRESCDWIETFEIAESIDDVRGIGLDSDRRAGFKECGYAVSSGEGEKALPFILP